MVGTWFGHGQPGEPGAMYIDRMRADGRWRGEYRSCVKGKPRDTVQAGRWSLSGDKLVLQVESVDGISLSRTDRYRMLAHDAKTQKYITLPSNFVYTPRRMVDNFQMPDCDLIS